MFRVSANLEETTTKKKKLLFISKMSPNELSSFEPKNFENNKIQSQSNSKFSSSSSLTAPLPIPKNNSNFFGNSNNNYNNHKTLPMKRILFRLYRVNFTKKEKGKTQTQNKKEINLKKNGNNNLKHKQRHLPTKNNNINYNNKNYSAGRWKSDEHQRFIDAIIRYGNNWRQVQKCVGTRSSTQTRSHAQKFFEKLKRSKIFKREKYDFSKNSLKILHDIMKNLPDKEYNQTLQALLSLSYERNNNSEKDNNISQNNNEDINYNNNNNNNCYENNENHIENINYEGNNIANYINNEENTKYIKLSNQGYYFLECNNNKNCNNEDYFSYNNINNSNGIIMIK